MIGPVNCIHQWRQVGCDPFRGVIDVRCVGCKAVGQILRPTGDELLDAFYATESQPIAFDGWDRVSSSANRETLSWSGH